MTITVSEIYDAFREANVSDGAARKAAEVIAAFDTHITELQRKIESRISALEIRFERMESRLTFLQRQQGLLMGGVAALIIKSFF